MYNVHIGKSPRYLADTVQPTSSRATRSSLRFLSETDSYTVAYTTPRLRTKFGERAFSFSGPCHGTLFLLNYVYAPSLYSLFTDKSFF